MLHVWYNQVVVMGGGMTPLLDPSWAPHPAPLPHSLTLSYDCPSAALHPHPHPHRCSTLTSRVRAVGRSRRWARSSPAVSAPRCPSLWS